MFSYLDNSMQATWLTILLFLWATLLFGGFLFGSKGGERRMPIWTRLGSSVVLMVAGFSWVLIGRDFGLVWYALLIAIGMVFGLLGDLALAKVIISGKKGNLAGIGAFAVGHIFYIKAIWLLGNDLGLTALAPRLGGLIIWWLVATLGWYLVVYRGSTVSSLHWIVLFYALLLSTTAGAATGLALQEAAFWPLALGAGLFLFSDTLIGGNWFNDLKFRYIHDLIWLTYGPAQMLIVFSVGAAIRLVG